MTNDTDQIAEHFTKIAALIGEKSRAAMLWSLLDGRSYTATELAIRAGISPSAASNHLSLLIKANFLKVSKQGRHRYYSFAHEQVARAVEQLASLTPNIPLPQSNDEPVKGLKFARTCYDHLAGKIGVDITHSLINTGVIVDGEEAYLVTPFGDRWFGDMGIDVGELRHQRRRLAFPCLDWSERKHHLGGALGSALLRKMLAKDWLRRVQYSREVQLTALGEKSLRNKTGLSF